MLMPKCAIVHLLNVAASGSLDLENDKRAL